MRNLGLLAIWICANSAFSADTQVSDKAAFVICGACHSVNGEPKAGGPSLKAIFGRAAASDPKYTRYSQALKASKIVWTQAELDAFLKAPTTKVKGTSMIVSTPDSARRAAVIRYLQTLK